MTDPIPLAPIGVLPEDATLCYHLAIALDAMAWCAKRDVAVRTILREAEAILPDPTLRGAALRTAVVSWDPRTGLDGLRSLFASFAPLGSEG